MSSPQTPRTMVIPADYMNAAYLDPEADMLLQTSDNVGFRVHSYYLRASR
jgi:hypothetical protein